MIFRFTKEHRAIALAMEAVLQLFNGLSFLDIVLPKASIDGRQIKIVLEFLARFGADAILDKNRNNRIRMYRSFSIINIIDENKYDYANDQKYQNIKDKTGASTRIMINKQQIIDLFFISELLRETITEKPVPHFGIIFIEEHRTIIGKSGDKSGELFLMLPDNEGLSWADNNSFYEEISDKFDSKEMPHLHEYIAIENSKLLNDSRRGPSVAQIRNKPAKIEDQIARYGHLTEINRHFVVHPYTDFAERVLAIDPTESDFPSVPDIRFNEWLSLNQIIRSIIVNYCIYFGGIGRIKLCQQCGTLIIEKRQNMKKFCSASCRFAYSREEENPNRRKCRNRQNKYIDNLSLLPEGKIGYHIYKDDCTGCNQFVKSGQCQKLIELNKKLIPQS